MSVTGEGKNIKEPQLAGTGSLVRMERRMALDSPGPQEPFSPIVFTSSKFERKYGTFLHFLS
jgi:hypothetical protein